MPSPLNDPQVRPSFRPFVSRHKFGLRWVYAADELVDDNRFWRRLKAGGRDGAYLFLASAGWLSTNLLAVLGCAVAAFLVLSGGDLDLFFAHLNNLTSRYVVADLGRKAAFEHGLVQGFLILLTVVVLLRAPSFIRRTRAELGRDAEKAI